VTVSDPADGSDDEVVRFNYKLIRCYTSRYFGARITFII
jgi:hypothetical protein